ncbi:unnamed protein product [Colletotrichum noveboracense]|uniref:Uncharacterized protein n=1 Tax=Colletotrichum noveboracense TaxID=2664923 RepID=A0A9W4WB48_9PEZI|nr:unnamed protein product [Colletotrichum noveboracense]
MNAENDNNTVNGGGPDRSSVNAYHMATIEHNESQPPEEPLLGVQNQSLHNSETFSPMTYDEGHQDSDSETTEVSQQRPGSMISLEAIKIKQSTNKRNSSTRTKASLASWWEEILCCGISVVALIALIVVLRAFG